MEKKFRKGLGNLIGIGTEGLIHASKVITYPILGNLSGTLKTRIEEKIGGEYFDAENATNISCLTNFGIYPLALCNLVNSNDPSIFISTTLLAGAEYGFGKYLEPADETFPRDCPEGRAGSIIGKIISLPIEYLLNLHDKVKNTEKIKCS